MDQVLTLAIEYRRADVALMRAPDDKKATRAAIKAERAARSALLRAKPATYEGALTLVRFVMRELSYFEGNEISRDLRRAKRDLARGRFAYCTWTWLDVVVQMFRKYTSGNQWRQCGTAIRAVRDFVAAQGGKPDPRRLSVRLV
jgi:hypothetical protein